MTPTFFSALFLLLSVTPLIAQPAPFLLEDAFPERAADSSIIRQRNAPFTSRVALKQAAYDTIYVSEQMTTYMIFPEDVAIMDLGSKSYTGKIESGNMLYLKPLKANAAPSSLLVRTTGERIYLHYIAYRQDPRKIFWDYRPDSLSPGFSKEESKAAQLQEAYIRKLSELGKLRPNRLATYRANRLLLRASNLAVDKQTTYLLLEVVNYTSIPYRLDYVSFAYKERHARKSLRRIEPEEHVVEPLAQVVAPAIAPLGRETLGYALPLYAGTNRNFLEVTLREAGGNRTLRIRIPARKIARSRYMPSPGDTHQNPSTTSDQSHVPQTNP